MRYASFGVRALALVIDMAILSVGIAILALVIPRRSLVGENLDFAACFLYYSLFESSRHQGTIGKRVLGIAVSDVEGRRLSLPRAAIRTLAKLLSLLICGMGFVLPLLTARRQALHDLLTDAVVIYK